MKLFAFLLFSSLTAAAQVIQPSSGSVTLPVAITDGGTGQITVPLAAVALGAAQTAAANTFSVAGAASTPAVSITGLPFAGTGTTSTPQLYMNAGASAPTTFSTAGTAIGVNSASASTANFLDFHVNGGVSAFSVGSTGRTFANSFENIGAFFTINSTALAMANTWPLLFSSTGAASGTKDLGVCRQGIGILQVSSGTTCNNGNGVLQANLAAVSYGQSAASSTGGTCAMSTSTSCTITLGHTFTTPVCIATQQSATLTGGSVGCTISGTTVTITAAVANSETWGAFVFGNPN